MDCLTRWLFTVLIISRRVLQYTLVTFYFLFYDYESLAMTIHFMQQVESLQRHLAMQS